VRRKRIPKLRTRSPQVALSAHQSQHAASGPGNQKAAGPRGPGWTLLRWLFQLTTVGALVLTVSVSVIGPLSRHDGQTGCLRCTIRAPAKFPTKVDPFLYSRVWHSRELTSCRHAIYSQRSGITAAQNLRSNTVSLSAVGSAARRLAAAVDSGLRVTPAAANEALNGCLPVRIQNCVAIMFSTARTKTTVPSWTVLRDRPRKLTLSPVPRSV